MRRLKYVGIRKLPPTHRYPSYYTAEVDGRTLGVFSSRDTAVQAIRRIIRKLEGK